MNFFSILVRSLNEPFINEFIDHYLSEGADKIHVIIDGENNLFQKYRSSEKIKIYPATFCTHEQQLKDVQTIYSEIRYDTEWLAFVDADEFLITRRNAKNTLRAEIKEVFSEVDLIRVPWVMFSSHGRGQYEKILGLRKWDPNSLRQEIVFRWNHDKFHPHPFNWQKGRCRHRAIETKAIFKPKNFENIYHPHFPKPSNSNIICVDGVDGRKAPIHYLYEGLHEAEIGRAFFTCNHYRIPSFESCVRKTRNNKLSGYSAANALKNLICTDYGEVLDDAAAKRFNFNKLK